MTWDPKKDQGKLPPEWQSSLARFYYRNWPAIWGLAALAGWVYFAFLYESPVMPEHWTAY